MNHRGGWDERRGRGRDDVPARAPQDLSRPEGERRIAWAGRTEHELPHGRWEERFEPYAPSEWEERAYGLGYPGWGWQGPGAWTPTPPPWTRWRMAPPSMRGGALRGPHVGRGPKGWRRSDERIYDEVCELLAREERLDPSDITVRVERGEVTLEGTVPDRQQKRLAEDLAEQVFGVEDVHNRLRTGRERGEQEARP